MAASKKPQRASRGRGRIPPGFFGARQRSGLCAVEELSPDVKGLPTKLAPLSPSAARIL
jgi:hypothetical protein